MRKSLGLFALRILPAAFLTTAVAANAARADLASDLRDCARHRDANAGIAACTRLLASGDLNLNAEAVAHSNRGTRYHRLRHHRKALADYDRAIALKPEFLAVYVKRGDVYMALGQPKMAVADYTKAIDKRPKPRDKKAKALVTPVVIDLYIRRSLAYQKLGRRGPAINDVNRALAL
ncbi:MAG: tetratricopeptide repeat protein, partial [Alphaproteobacteria bacterium]|nr:tetratricopeptide repeat protein [Alphaproteobacteria bacterium]